MHGYKMLERDGCFIMNFGYKGSIPYPSLSFSFDNEFPLNVGTAGVGSPNRCNIILIAGDFLDDIDRVMKVADDFAEDIQHMTSAAFMFPRVEEAAKNPLFMELVT